MSRATRAIAILSWSTLLLLLGCAHRQVEQPPLEAEGEEAAAPPCARDLSACPVQGCAAAGSDAARFNELKRGGSAPVIAADALPVTIDALTRLQALADSQLSISRRDFSAATREKLTALTLDGRRLGEGALVRLAGFIVVATNDPQKHHGAHPNTGETVNCNLRDPDSNDFHIPVVADPNDKDCKSVTAEMIPQGRAARWTLDLLHDQIAPQRKQVMVVGPLFYDNAHDVDSNCTSPSSGNPKRLSLFEVHPVRELYVCNRGSCTADDMAGWDKVD